MKFDSHLRARDVEALVYSQFANPRSAVTDPEHGSGWAPRLTSMASAAKRSISVFATAIRMHIAALKHYFF
jgi:hypothetical protein